MTLENGTLIPYYLNEEEGWSLPAENLREII